EIIVNYPDDNQDGVVDNTTINENTLKIYTPDGLGGLEELSDIVVDPVANTVRGTTSHFSYFVISGTPGSHIEDWNLF
ncbi:MAG: hypothetical protein NT106_13135, partial [Candidatus Sumerlaeota bacterium]|nr:hypothetical protein [Candidatus Sumerlaeota bacterium]